MTQAKRPRILYVEDDPASRALVQRVLQAEGFEVDFAGDGVAALEVARRVQPGLILMDINSGASDVLATLSSSFKVYPICQSSAAMPSVFTKHSGTSLVTR